MSDFQKNICDYCCSGHALININTFEKDRAISEIAEAAKTIDRKIYIWNVAEGWKDEKGIAVSKVKATAPIEDQLSCILQFPENIICILRDFGGYMKHDTYPGYDVVVSWLDVLRKIVSSVNQNIIFVGPDFQVPKPLLHDITQVSFDLPDNEQINERIEFVCSDVVSPDGTKFEPNKKIIPQVIDACRGMTASQTCDRVALALRKHKDLNADAIETIFKEKAGVIRASGLLTYIEPPKGGLENVGGYEALKQHILLDKPCFTDKAREFGIEFPRGILMVGIPGCGKTLLSLAISSELNLPLIAMDVGNLMDKYVGESESNMREAIKMVESIAPCVLQLDEIEKGFGGSGDTDGGSSRRVFGTFLKWMSDRKSPVYVIATANQVQSLPMEFTRKGRFDEIYGLDLPAMKERQEIFCIHLSKRSLEPGSFDLSKLAETTNSYTGADIQEVVKLGLKIAFSQNEQLTMKHLEKSITEIIPLSQTESDRIEHIRQWCSKHAKSANPPKKIDPPVIGRRKVTLS